MLARRRLIQAPSGGSPCRATAGSHRVLDGSRPGECWAGGGTLPEDTPSNPPPPAPYNAARGVCCCLRGDSRSSACMPCGRPPTTPSYVGRRVASRLSTPRATTVTAASAARSRRASSDSSRTQYSPSQIRTTRNRNRSERPQNQRSCRDPARPEAAWPTRADAGDFGRGMSQVQGRSRPTSDRRGRGLPRDNCATLGDHRRHTAPPKPTPTDT